MSGVVACGVWHTHPGVHWPLATSNGAICIHFVLFICILLECFSLERQTCIEYFLCICWFVPVTINEIKSVCVLFKCKSLHYLCRAKALDGCGRSLKITFELTVKQTLMIIWCCLLQGSRLTFFNAKTILKNVFIHPKVNMNHSNIKCLFFFIIVIYSYWWCYVGICTQAR